MKYDELSVLEKIALIELTMTIRQRISSFNGDNKYKSIDKMDLLVKEIIDTAREVANQL